MDFYYEIIFAKELWITLKITRNTQSMKQIFYFINIAKVILGINALAVNKVLRL